MAIPNRNPGTIHLGGEITRLEGWVVSTTLKPGMVAEPFLDSGTIKLRPHSSATETPRALIVMEKTLFGGRHRDEDILDVTYAVGEVCYNIAEFHVGSTFYALVPSGANITQGDPLQSNGDGKLKEATSTTAAGGVYKFQSLDTLGLVNADTRCRVQVIK